ncbi:phosphoribosylanthranilate isomerase [Pelagirhabdus alkalitolerans]|uniref:N-(5'-phosphoribosyl)anthranilate isomerase n=1 Tax=Pelagirhabdus alkalitolerans TaxID=1612202 RepID=A0A1G6GJV5_9BACI|nr:phosphoribosylanthranilate isomerase [Pelagirhabdus alkalitolerans]SDB82025.1 phosphoribosylanthranilate isomerase [Pelagirhabdus alkalitolerans]
MIVKICGLTDASQVHAATRLGADLIGFVFAKSKRQVTAEDVKTWIPHIVGDAKAVGVFVNQSIDEINKIVQKTGLDYVQLHGQETVADCRNCLVPVIKAVSVSTEADLDKIDAYLEVCEYVLIDGATPGSGQPFDWRLLERINHGKDRLILAGGLNPDNVNHAIEKTGVGGVDVSSGVETEGKKDEDKIHAFIQSAKEGSR